MWEDSHPRTEEPLRSCLDLLVERKDTLTITVTYPRAQDSFRGALHLDLGFPNSLPPSLPPVPELVWLEGEHLTCETCIPGKAGPVNSLLFFSLSPSQQMAPIRHHTILLAYSNYESLRISVGGRILNPQESNMLDLLLPVD